MTNKELAKIVKDVKHNKQQNFEKLFNEICKTIYCMSFHILQDKTEAEDATQDILIYIYKHIDELQLAEGFNSWMNRIILGICKNMIRKKVNAKDNIYTEEYCSTRTPDSETVPEQVILSKEERDALLEIITQLPIKQKEVILLYYYQQMSAPEIAEILECSVGAVQNRIFKARKAIERKIEDNRHFSPEKLRSVSVFTLLPGLYTYVGNQYFNGDLHSKIWQRFCARTECKALKKRSILRELPFILKKYIVLWMILFCTVTGISAAWIYYHQPSSGYSADKILDGFGRTEEINISDNILPESSVNILQETVLENSGQSNSADEVLNDDGGSHYTITELQENTVRETYNFNNKAQLIDTDKQSMKYEQDSGRVKAGENVFSEAEYKVSSERVYHRAMSVPLSKHLPLFGSQEEESFLTVTGDYRSDIILLWLLFLLASFGLIVSCHIKRCRKY